MYVLSDNHFIESYCIYLSKTEKKCETTNSLHLVKALAVVWWNSVYIHTYRTYMYKWYFIQTRFQYTALNCWYFYQPVVVKTDRTVYMITNYVYAIHCLNSEITKLKMKNKTHSFEPNSMLQLLIETKTEQPSLVVYSDRVWSSHKTAKISYANNTPTKFRI